MKFWTSARGHVAQFLHNASHFPWKTTALTLRERFREDRLGVTASSLTFTTIISLVPLFAVGLAVFSAFPMFARLQASLQKWLIDSLVPDAIARQVLTYLNQFAAKAGQMGWTGALILLATALALVLTIDRKLNDIWRVRRPRPLAQRVLVYWGVLTLGPLLMGASLTLTSYALALSRDFVGNVPGGIRLVLDCVELLLVGAGMVLLFRYVPNTGVMWRHALAGGVFVALGIAAARQLLGWYLAEVPTYSLLYGAFATVPILLVWIYLLWVIVLLGAVVAAYLPSLMGGVARRSDSPGWDFQLALEVVAQLNQCRPQPDGHGLGLGELAQRLRVDVLQLEAPLATLQALDWVGRLDEEGQRYVLLSDLAQTPVAPLVERLLVPEGSAANTIWHQAGWRTASVESLLPTPPVVELLVPLPVPTSAAGTAPRVDPVPARLPKPASEIGAVAQA